MYCVIYHRLVSYVEFRKGLLTCKVNNLLKHKHKLKVDLSSNYAAVTKGDRPALVFLVIDRLLCVQLYSNQLSITAEKGGERRGALPS